VYVDNVVFTPGQLESLVTTFGAGQILMGTDYPFDMLEYDPIGHINSVRSFDEATRAALCGGNAKTLLGL
jgi:aminocarboxymuconate-semialdehyde decarboxylase